MEDNVQTVNQDLIVDMEEAGVGVAEILQYARGVLREEEIRAVIHGLRELVDLGLEESED